MEEDDEIYGEDDFELEDEVRSQKSPIKIRAGTPKLNLSAAIQKELAAMGSEGNKRGLSFQSSDNGVIRSAASTSSQQSERSDASEHQQGEKEDYNNILDDGDLDLEKYMSNMGFAASDHSNKSHLEASPAILQPLDGLQPAENDHEQKRIREKLGYAIQTAQNISASLESNKRNLENIPVSSGSTRNHFQDNLGSILPESGVDEATKVDNLLMELFPERYAGKVSKKKLKDKTLKKDKPKQNQQQHFGLAAARVQREEEEEEEEEGSEVQPKDVLSTLDSQLKLLKKELKVKDEKITRLTDHSTMLANQLDRYKGEVARLNAKLHEAAMELEAKESRLVEALKAKKKASKKAAQTSSPSQDKPQGFLEGEICRLRDREQALLDAVEELSSQNEDLIIKLRESMQRELELSSKRAALVSHTIARSESHMLPSIHEPGSGSQSHRSVGSDCGVRGEHVRSQSEPSIAVPPKRGSKKKKKSSAF